MQKLSDGTIIPSNLTTSNKLTASTNSYNNFSLKIGSIVSIIYPEDKANQSKNVIEYNVTVAERVGNNSTNTVTYRNCIVSNIFGGLNNGVNFTYDIGKVNNSTGITDGDTVLILCIDGKSQGNNSVIIGGLPKKSKKYSKKDGQFYDFTFNGIKWKIDKDGQMELSFGGAEDFYGKKVDKEATGTKLFIDKEGKLTLTDKENQRLFLDRINQVMLLGNDDSNIEISKKEKTVTQKSAGEFNVKSEKNFTLKSSKSIEMMAKTDFTVEAMASATIRAKQSITLKSDARMTIQSGADMTIKSGANVSIESPVMVQTKAPLTLLGAGTNPVAIAGVSIAFGTNGGGPMVSTILTGSVTVLAGT